jgi:predicted NUDIX family phosphoesterase
VSDQQPEELVLAIDSAALARLFAEKTGDPQAVWLPAAAAPVETWLPGIRKAFLPRSMAEISPEWRHVATYTTLVSEDKVFTYRRGKSGSEGRLHGKLSVGVGGHVALGDYSYNRFPGRFDRQMFDYAAEREAMEELEVESFIKSKLAGFLATSETAVDRVHLGAVYTWSIFDPRGIVAREDCLADPRWMTREELAGYADELESWSRIAAREVLGVPIGEGA